jgi:hypothetical protein
MPDRERNIQKELGSLFSKDYAKDHRAFRPSDEIHMKLRFNRIRQFDNGRICKPARKSQAQKRLNIPVLAASFPCTAVLETQKSAFRNYSEPYTQALQQHL